MKITNKSNLPKALVDAVERHEHKRGNFSVTQLLKGSTEIALEMMYADKLEMDVADMFNMLLGTAVHQLLEEQRQDGILNEYYMEVPSFAGFTVSGIADVIDTMIEEIRDYKTCASWKIVFKDFEDWRRQGKAYCYLWHVLTGKLYTHFKVVAVIKDFSQTEAERKSDYPQKPIITIPFEYTYEEIMGVGEEWEEKIIEVLQKLASQDFGECSAEERWAKPAKYALMKEGRKTAIKLYDTEMEALMAKEQDPSLRVEYRAGEDTKCDKYCVCGKCGLCPYKNSKEQKNG